MTGCDIVKRQMFKKIEMYKQTTSHDFLYIGFTMCQ
jgi:hypothetical protein